MTRHATTPNAEHGTTRCDGCRELAQVTRIAELEALIAAAPHTTNCSGWRELPWDGGSFPQYDFDDAECDCWKADAPRDKYSRRALKTIHEAADEGTLTALARSVNASRELLAE